MENYKVSIIIPSYNNEHVIEQAIDSIISQENCGWECVVVDDGSVDATLEILEGIEKKDCRFKIFRRPQTLIKGANSCRNYGFNKSTGNLIQWFDADDIMHPAFLKSKVQALINSEADFVVCKGVIFEDKVENNRGYWDELTGQTPLIDQALGKINFQTNAPMFRRDFLEGKNKWNENLQRKQDYEFFNRILAQSTNYKTINRCLFFYRQHSQSINGTNSPATLRSMICADLLVYNNTLQTLNSEDEKFRFQQHFFRKILFRSTLARRNNYWFTYFRGIRGALSIIDLNYLKNYCIRK